MNKIEYTQSRQSEGGNDISASVFGFPMSTRCSLPSQNDWKKRKITAYALARNNIISSLPQKRPFASANFREVPPIKKKKKVINKENGIQEFLLRKWRRPSHQNSHRDRPLLFARLVFHRSSFITRILIGYFAPSLRPEEGLRAPPEELKRTGR